MIIPPENISIDTWTAILKKNQDKVCLKPFQNFEIFESGDVVVCCPGWMRDGLVIGNIFRNTYAEIWNSDVVKNIRKSVVDGSFSFCNEKCSHLISGLLTCRADVPLKYTRAVNEPCKDLDLLPAVIKISYDRSCNLWCFSCRKEKYLIKPDLSEKLLKANKEVVYPLLKDASKIQMLGSGEFLASKACLDLLSMLDKKTHGNLVCTFLTNGTLLNKSTWSSLSGLSWMKKSINLSFDGARKTTFETLRRGSNFDIVMKNLKFMSSLLEQGEITNLALTVTVQEANFKELPQIIDIAKDHNVSSIFFLRMINIRYGNDISNIDIASIHHPLHDNFKQILRIIRYEKIVNLGSFVALL